MHLVSTRPGSPNTCMSPRLPGKMTTASLCVSECCPRPGGSARGLSGLDPTGVSPLGAHQWGCRVWPDPILRGLWEQCVCPQAQGSFQSRGGLPACSPPPSSPQTLATGSCCIATPPSSAIWDIDGGPSAARRGQEAVPHLPPCPHLPGFSPQAQAPPVSIQPKVKALPAVGPRGP